jgi:hypothetical protein
MSSLTSWLSIGALVIVALFCVNAIVYRVRYGTFLRKAKGQRSALKRKLTKSEVAAGMFICVALLIGVAAPVIAPASAFATWMREPYSLLEYAVWCWLIATIIAVGPKVFELLRKKSDA